MLYIVLYIARIRLREALGALDEDSKKKLTAARLLRYHYQYNTIILTILLIIVILMIMIMIMIAIIVIMIVRRSSRPPGSIRCSSVYSLHHMYLGFQHVQAMYA